MRGIRCSFSKKSIVSKMKKNVPSEIKFYLFDGIFLFAYNFIMVFHYMRYICEKERILCAFHNISRVKRKCVHTRRQWKRMEANGSEWRQWKQMAAGEFGKKVKNAN